MGSSFILFLFNPFFFSLKSSSIGSCFTDSLKHKKKRGQSLSLYIIKVNELLLTWNFQSETCFAVSCNYISFHFFLETAAAALMLKLHTLLKLQFTRVRVFLKTNFLGLKYSVLFFFILTKKI